MLIHPHTLLRFLGGQPPQLSAQATAQWSKNKKLTGCHRDQVYKFKAFQLTGLSTVHILFKGKTEAIEGSKVWDTSMAFMHLSIA